MVKLSEEEIWLRLAGAHTAIVTTLRRDGMPISLPVWFVVEDRTVVFSSPTRARKVDRLVRDPRAALLVESGRYWRDLAAVHLTGTVQFERDKAEIQRLDGLIARKYAPYRDTAAMPHKAQQHYAEKTFMRLVPEERVLSWDNSRIALGSI
jgi:PPOX class probable F420-dependent enzyme